MCCCPMSLRSWTSSTAFVQVVLSFCMASLQASQPYGCAWLSNDQLCQWLFSLVLITVLSTVALAVMEGFCISDGCFWCLEIMARWGLTVAWLVTAILVTISGSIDGRARKADDPSSAIATIALTWALFLVSLVLSSLRLSSLICCCLPQPAGYESLGYQGLGGAAVLAAGAATRRSPLTALAEVLCLAWLIRRVTSTSYQPTPRATRQATITLLPPPPPPPIAYPDYSGNTTAYVGFHPGYAGRVYHIPPSDGGMAMGIPAPQPPLPPAYYNPRQVAPVPPTMEVNVGSSSTRPAAASEGKDGYEAPSAPMEDR